ncbi:MAG: DUF4336 domain-containing protein [Synechococcaceae bacterium WB9_2_112]|nr:DUF4336 domain-containing protein [Synechococcaceae bacterium WB9_2_112]
MQPGSTDPWEERWPWWPLLPLYPYGRKATLVRELVPGQVWGFEQLQGFYYVAVPIRMTVLKLRQGLLLYAPVAPTAAVRRALGQLEAIHGPVQTIVLPSSSGLEHKLPVPAMARAVRPISANVGTCRLAGRRYEANRARRHQPRRRWSAVSFRGSSPRSRA